MSSPAPSSPSEPAPPRIIDISPPLTADTAVFPGDTPLGREVLLDRARGDSVTLSTLRGTVHLGAHADAPSHYAPRGRSIEAQPLDLYCGPCRVIHAHARRGMTVTLDDLPDDIDRARILIRTGTMPDPEHFPHDFSGIDPDLVTASHDLGVRLVGIDTPSVDPAESQDLPAHARFARHDMAILEMLRLDHVPAGTYDLVALPLPLVGFDASPVRAVLLDRSE